MNQDQTNQPMNEWLPEQPSQPTSLEQMDQLIAKLQAARLSYEEAKKASATLYHALEEVEKEVLNTLKANGRSKYEVEGIGLAYISHKETYPTPKSVQDKTKLFQYIKDKYGVEALLNMQSINHQTLNSWANKEVEAEPTLQIPGLEAPVAVESLNFRKK